MLYLKKKLYGIANSVIATPEFSTSLVAKPANGHNPELVSPCTDLHKLSA
jgi:hypothetical protein